MSPGEGTGVVKIDVGGIDPARANRLPRSPPAVGRCTRRRASASAHGAWLRGSTTESFRAARRRTRNARHPRRRGHDVEPRAGRRRDRARLTEEAIATFNAGRPGRERARAARDPPPARRAARGPRRQRQTSATRPDHPGVASVSRSKPSWIARGRARRTLKLRHTAVMRSTFPCSLDGGALPQYPPRSSPRPRRCARTNWSSVTIPRSCPPTTPPSQPYWLRKAGTAGLFRRRRSVSHRPAREPARVPDRVRLRSRRSDAGDLRRADAGRGSGERGRAAAATGGHRAGLAAVRRGRASSSRPAPSAPVTVDLTAARAGAAGTVQFDAPAGWSRDAGLAAVSTRRPGRAARFTFTVTAPPQLATAPLGASVEINGRRFNQQRIEVRYDHLPLQLLQPPARARSGVARAGDSRPPRRLPAGRRRRRGRRPGADGLRGHAPDRRRPDAGKAARPRRGGHRHPRLQRADGSRRAPARRCSRTSRPAARSSHSTTPWTACARVARAVPAAPLARPRDRRARAGDDPGARASGADHAESHHRGGFRGLGAGARALLPRSMGRALHRRSSPSATPASRRSRAACSWRGTARATSSTPASRGFASFPKACPARIGCSRISSRWANDARATPPTSPRRPSRPASPDSAPGAASTCSCSGGSCSW